MKKNILILLLSFLPFFVAAQITVTAKLDSIAMLIGDQRVVTVNIAHNPNIQLGGIDMSAMDTVTGIEILKVNPPATISSTPEEILVEQKIQLTSFTEGYFTLPPITVPYTRNGKGHTLQTKQLLLKVNTLEVSEATELQSIKGIIAEPFMLQDYLPYIVLIGGLLLIAFVAWYLIKQSRKKEIFGEFAKKKLPAHIIALKKLKKLDELQLWQSGKIKSFQSQITFVLREYLEGRFDVPALESTTDEIVSNLKAIHIDKEVIDELQTILQTADLVKFAKSEPPADVHQQAFDNITAFVNQTIPQVQTETDD